MIGLAFSGCFGYCLAWVWFGRVVVWVAFLVLGLVDLVVSGLGFCSVDLLVLFV